MGNEGNLVGRDTELAALEEVLASAQPGLLLLVGGPGTGKARLLRELRARATAYPCTVVPASQSTPEEAARLVIDKQSTIDGFRRALLGPRDDVVSVDEMNRRDFDLVLVYGYRPDELFHKWFTEDFVPGLAAAHPPRAVVVACSSGDAAQLEPLALRRVVLGPLPRDAIVAELREINTAIDEPLEDNELEVYADAIATNPSLLEAFRHVLPLTLASRQRGRPDVSE